MDYKKLIESAKALDFVADEATADAVIKSVLGHFASRIQEEKARDFINDLPFPLTFEKLRGHQINTYRIPVEAFIDDMQEQFALTYDQAFTAITTVLEAVISQLPAERARAWKENLPPGWKELFLVAQGSLRE